MNDHLDLAALVCVLAASLLATWSWQAAALAVLLGLGLHGAALYCEAYRR